MKFFLAMPAVTHAGAVPAIDEDAIDAVARHDFALHFGHEFEVVRTEAAGHPHFGRGPMAAGLAVGFDSDPVRMRGLDVVVGGVRIGTGNDDHAEFATAGDEFAKRIGIAEPLTAMMKRDVGWIVGDATAGAQANSVGFCALKKSEPKFRIELAGIVFDQGELSPAHRFVHPGGGGCDWIGGAGGRNEIGEGNCAGRDGNLIEEGTA